MSGFLAPTDVEEKLASQYFPRPGIGKTGARSTSDDQLTQTSCPVTPSLRVFGKNAPDCDESARDVSSWEMTSSSMQRNLLGLTLLVIVGLTVLLLGRKLTLEARKRDSLLLDMIANISGSLDRLDGGLDDVVARTGTARNHLRHLVALHRENLLVCALLGEKQRQRRTSPARGG